MYNLNHE